MPALLALTVAAALVLGPAPSETSEPAPAPVEGPRPIESTAPTVDDSESTGELGARSHQGTRRGALEFGLGSLLAGTAVGLIVYASLEVVRAGARKRQCALGSSSDGLDPCLYDPPALGYTAAGLGYGFSVPLFVGAGLLYARGAKTLADARRWDAAQRATLTALSPWWSRRGGGLSVTLRF